MLERHTWNNFKSSVASMSDVRKKEFLTELQAEYMTEKSRRAQQHTNTNVKILRRKIAYMKTILHEPGYHYNPRG